MSEQGTTGIKLKITVTAALTAIVNLLDVNFPGQRKTLADFTSHPTTGATTYKKFIDSGVRELTAFTAQLGWDSSEATHAAVLAALNSTDPVGMSIEDPAGDEVIGFDAHIEQVNRLGRMGDGYRADVVIQPTGAPTIT